MRPPITVAIIASIVALAPVSGLETVQSPDWKEPPAELRAQYALSAPTNGELLDFTLGVQGGMVSLHKAPISEAGSLEAFELFAGGMQAAFLKRGYSVCARNQGALGPILGSGVLLEGSGPLANSRALLWKAFTESEGYLFLYVSDASLDFDSAFVRSYLSRLRFPSEVHWVKTALVDARTKQWEAGNRSGEVLIWIAIALVVFVAAVFWRLMRAKTAEPGATVNPDDAQHLREDH